MKRKDLQPRLLYPAKLLFRTEGQIKCFPEKVKLKEFIITKPLLYEIKYLKKKIKTMNIKMASNSQLSTTESKNKNENKNLTSNQNRNRIIGMGIIWRLISWAEKGGERGKWYRDEV